MGKANGKRRAKQDRRRKRKQKQGKREVQRAVAVSPGRRDVDVLLDELFSPESLAVLLPHFAHACPELPPAFGFPSDAFHDVLLEPWIDDGSLEAPVLPKLVISRLAGPELARSCRDALWECRQEVFARSGDDPDVGDALSMVGIAGDRCVSLGGPADHGFWNFVFERTFEGSLRGGLLEHLVRLRVREDPGVVTARYGAALRDSELASDLAVLEDWLDPAALARAYCELVERGERGQVELDFSAALHLARVQGYVRAVLSERLMEEGPTPALLGELWALVDEAFARDVTPQVCEQALEEAAEVLDDAEWVADDEMNERLATYVALRAFPPSENALLRLGHVTTPFCAADGAETEEEALRVEAILEDPEGGFNLEQYASCLLDCGDREGQRRVQRYRETLRVERDRFLPASTDAE